MTHPLKQRLDRMSNQELDSLESILMVVLHDAQGDDAITTVYITIVSKALGIDPPRGN